MVKTKVICTIITLIGITGLTISGANALSIGALIPIGVGLGSAISALIAILIKKKEE